MKIKRLILIAYASIATLQLLSGQKTFTASVFNTAASMPGGSFGLPFHPGVDLGYVLSIKEGARWDQNLILRAGYFNQRLVHHGIQLYGEYTWRFKITKYMATDLGLGVGYLHTIEQHSIFKLQADGTYRQEGKSGKAHFQGSASLGLAWTPETWKIHPFLSYRFRLMTPFVNEYVPIFPATSLHLGAFFKLF